jgi:lysylphosphatidylglycerol synthetase-like protein (DUF2156 family)
MWERERKQSPYILLMRMCGEKRGYSGFTRIDNVTTLEAPAQEASNALSIGGLQDLQNLTSTSDDTDAWTAFGSDKDTTFRTAAHAFWIALHRYSFVLPDPILQRMRWADPGALLTSEIGCNV